MKIICEHNSCTGCGLCVSLCPVSCITMRIGKQGHMFPTVDMTKCIDCGSCTKNCPVFNPVDLSESQHAFAAWARDEADYKSSTSGGVSSILAQYIVNHGGVVYGCAVSPGAIIEHIRIDKIEDLSRIKGSKYVQSSIVKILPLIRKDIMENRTVLFLGTPCQVAAVKKLFSSHPEKLYLVDLVCHGVPSQQSLHDYLKRHVCLDSVDNVTFRSEEGYLIKAFSNKDIVYCSPELWSCRYKDYYYNAFMDGFSFRDSCYECRYASPNRCSDITIGDFWGLGKEISSEDIPEHRFGISLVLTNTIVGRTLFQRVSDTMYCFERPIVEAVNGNDQLRHPKDKTGKAIVFRSLQPLLGDKIAYEFVRILTKVRNRLTR